ncbi:MAG: class I SAM-dependent methyltransferase [Prevotella sp.]|jgi:hypothetical protein|nr:class I SAM-dependent methyltransferase [Prevotella sp.]
MARIYRLSKAGLKLLYKIRHHRGHGIHSPFVFDLVTKVIEEKTAYHAYEDISFVLESMHDSHYRLSKYNKLIFRLSNYFESKHILEIGSGYGINSLCLSAPSANITCTCVETSKRKYLPAQNLYEKWDRRIVLYTGKQLPVIEDKQDCILIDLNNFNYFTQTDLNQYIVSMSYEKTMIIVKGIRTNKRNHMLWKSIISIEARTAVLDLFNTGIIFFNPELYRWSYKISF